jgi:uncharacterized protein YjiS (DUF1127 family)
VDTPAVDFELRFAWASRPDSTLLPLEVIPHPHQARQCVLELRQLDLDLRALRLGVTREDVEDELRAVDDIEVEDLFEVSCLSGREVVAEDDQIGTGAVASVLDFARLAYADVSGAVDARTALSCSSSSRYSYAWAIELLGRLTPTR